MFRLFWPLSSAGTATGSVVTQLYGWQPGAVGQLVAWSNTTDSIFNWSVLSSQVSSTDSLSIGFTVVADDEHAIIAIDDQSGYRTKDNVYHEP